MLQQASYFKTFLLLLELSNSTRMNGFMGPSTHAFGVSGEQLKKEQAARCMQLGPRQTATKAYCKNLGYKTNW